MQTVILNGDIAKFGTRWETSCDNIRDIFKLIECQTPGFREHLIEAAHNDVGYEIRRGKDILASPEELLLSISKEDIIITEVPDGAKSGLGKILAAVAILVVIGLTGGSTAGGFAGFFANISAAATGGGSLLGSSFLAQMGVFVATNLALTGISQLLAPNPSVDGVEQNSGYLFGGPVNNVAQGMPVPLLYGQLIVGGMPVAVHYQTTPINLGPYDNEGSVGSAVIDYTASDVALPPNNDTSDNTVSAPIPVEPLDDVVDRDPLMDDSIDVNISVVT